MTKSEIIKKLEELEIEFDPKSTKEELQELLDSVEKETKKPDTIKQEEKKKFFIPEK